MLCDFCRASHPVASYACATFQIEIAPQRLYKSVGDFFACKACSTLINAKDAPGLLRRSQSDSPDDSARKRILHLHTGFWSNRTL